MASQRRARGGACGPTPAASERGSAVWVWVCGVGVWGVGVKQGGEGEAEWKVGEAGGSCRRAREIPDRGAGARGRVARGHPRPPRAGLPAPRGAPAAGRGIKVK